MAGMVTVTVVGNTNPCHTLGIIDSKVGMGYMRYDVSSGEIGLMFIQEYKNAKTHST